MSSPTDLRPAPSTPTSGRLAPSAVAAAVLAVVAVVGAVVGLGLRGDGEASGCAFPAAGEASREVQPPEGDAPTGAVPVVLRTTVGEIALELDADAAPCAAASFASLAGQGFYDDTPCHRLVTGGGALLQCGDPTGTGSGGPGYSFADEALDGATYGAGTVAMANAGPDTNGSQFFLVIDDVPLPADYTPLGRITGGLEALEEVAADGSTPEGDGRPNTPVQLEQVRAG